MNFTTVITPEHANELLSQLRYNGHTTVWHRYTSKYFYGLILRSGITLEEIVEKKKPASLAVKVHKKLGKHADGSAYITGWNVDLFFVNIPDPEAIQVEIQIESFSSTLIAILERTESMIICQDSRGGSIGVVKFLPVT